MSVDGSHTDPCVVEASVAVMSAPGSVDWIVQSDLERAVCPSVHVDPYPVSEIVFYSQHPARDVIELYEINDEHQREHPFRTWARIRQSDDPGLESDAHATVDGGAMLCVMDKTFWSSVETHVGPLAESNVICKMANGTCIRSTGRGEATVRVANQWHPIQFEVLDARGEYDLLLGKPWLRTAGAAQVFVGDRLILAGPDGPIELENDPDLVLHPEASPVSTVLSPPPLTDLAHHQPAPEGELPNQPLVVERGPGEPVPVRRSRRIRGDPVEPECDDGNPFWVEASLLERLEQWTGMETEYREDWGRDEVAGLTQGAEERMEATQEESEDEFLERMWRLACAEREEQTQREILLTELTKQTTKTNQLDEILQRANRTMQRARGPVEVQVLEGILPQDDRHPSAQQQVNVPPVPPSDRARDPFMLERVAEILRRVTIGNDLSPEQNKRVSDLVSEFADVFALSLSEVLPVDFAEMVLDIPAGTSFPKRAGQRRLTEPQRQWLYRVLDDMEQAKIIVKVTQDQVAAVSPTNIVPKPGGAELPSLASLRNMANEQCEIYGLPIMWPHVEVEGPERQRPETETKYRLVHNFAAVNRVTQLRPFPMGDLAAMQRKVAEHKWISVMDFLAGFNAVPVAPASIPYTGFHVDG